MTARLPDLGAVGGLVRSRMAMLASAGSRDVPLSGVQASVQSVETLDGTAAKVTDNGPILVLGTPRSGTTWLGKIFDSHPDVLYRHEPDVVRQNEGLPWICPDVLTENHRRMADDYLRRLTATATLRTSGKPPFFPKSYRAPARSAVRTAIILTLRLLELSGADVSRLNRVPVPDMIPRTARDGVRLVLKSNSAHGRARAFAEAWPHARFVLILRDPWGYTASIRRGMTLGKMDIPPLDWIDTSTPGRRYGLTEARLLALPDLERLAWNWVISNEKVMDDLEGQAKLKVICYQDLCADPIRQTRDLFAFASLEWSRQTADFIARSTTFRGPERYYQVFKTSREALNRWRQELTEGEQRRVDAILRRSRLARFFPALES